VPVASTDSSNGVLMYQGFADLVVVVIKQNTDENMVTYLRIKYSGKNQG